ncbi:MAG: ribulose-phosphate 3-epimerase [Deferribacteraceae bacterium]|jgi:ribulose-phosphate 3-epimerase|nr:ribulose-phosphate 3-epimerase [Deferribacteraceae bacterium]
MIAPSLLSADFTRLGEEIDLLEKAGADLLHLDIMDGHFVPNISFGQGIVKQIHGITGLPLDVHLMISYPENFIDAFIDAGADIITIHVEAANHLHRLLVRIKEKGKKAGVSLNPATPVSSLSEIAAYCDLVLVMTVNPGFGGQSFIPEGTDKVKRVKTLLKEKRSDALIEVDGGVNDETAPLLWKAGADILVAGSYVFRSGDYGEAIDSILKR